MQVIQTICRDSWRAESSHRRSRANGLEPYAYLCLLLAELPKAKTAEDFEALLPFSVAPATLVQWGIS